jgi:hypothetical protein
MSHLAAIDALSAARIDILSANAALVVAHTSHELRLHAWLKRARPSVHILTTGSRSGDDTARIRASEGVVTERGARHGSTFGAMLDRDLYAAVMAGDAAPFERLTDQITRDLISQKAELVVVDGWQYYNAAHDIAHVIGRVAAREAGRILGRAVPVLDYSVVPAELAPHQPCGAPRYVLALSAEEREDKARTAAAFPDIQLELAELMGHEGERAIAAETFNEPPPLDLLLAAPAQTPEYERYGEERVKAGLYKDVLRWTHVERIVCRLAARTVRAR